MSLFLVLLSILSALCGIIFIIGYLIYCRNVTVRACGFVLALILTWYMANRYGRENAMSVMRSEYVREMKIFVSNLGELAKRGETNEIRMITSKFANAFKISLDERDREDFIRLVGDSYILIHGDPAKGGKIEREVRNLEK